MTAQQAWAGSLTRNWSVRLQIQHAGEGGLYAELVQDRSFSGLAYTQVRPDPSLLENMPLPPYLSELSDLG